MNDPVEEKGPSNSNATKIKLPKLQFTRGNNALSLSSTHTEEKGSFFRARINMDLGVKIGAKGEGTFRYVTMSQANAFGGMSDPTHFGIHRIVAGSDKFPFAKGLVEFRTNQEGLISGPRFGMYKDNFPSLAGVKPVFFTLAVGKRSTDPLSPDNGNVLGSVILLVKSFDQLKDFKIEFLNDVTIPFKRGNTPGSLSKRRIDEHLEFGFISPTVVSTNHADVKIFFSAQQDFGVPKGSSLLFGLRIQAK